MPIPTIQAFRKSTSPKSVFVSYGGNMGKVLAALEAYWENYTLGRELQERLLYCLWKEACHWLKLKAGKTGGSQMFFARKHHVEALRDAAMEELCRVSPQVGQMLGFYEENKLRGPLQFQLKGLSQGYDRERQNYLNSGKKSGGTISESLIYDTLKKEGNAKGMKKFTDKGFGNLSLNDTMQLAKRFTLEPVQYKNKIERMRSMVTVVAGLLCNFEGEPIKMTEVRHHQYEMFPYAMDKYGYLYMEAVWGAKRYVEFNPQKKTYSIKNQLVFNHSSFLAGKEVICAGCIHIGYNCGTRQLDAGVLGAIDNISGHYKPTTENLRNCLQVLRDQGVSIDSARVDVRTPDGDARYWGRAFMGGGAPWRAIDQPPPGFLKAPPIFPVGADV